MGMFQWASLCWCLCRLHRAVCVDAGPGKHCGGNLDPFHCSLSKHGSPLDCPTPETQRLKTHTHTHPSEKQPEHCCGENAHILYFKTEKLSALPTADMNIKVKLIKTFRRQLLAAEIKHSWLSNTTTHTHRYLRSAASSPSRWEALIETDSLINNRKKYKAAFLVFLVNVLKQAVYFVFSVKMDAFRQKAEVEFKKQPESKPEEGNLREEVCFKDKKVTNVSLWAGIFVCAPEEVGSLEKSWSSSGGSP